MEAELPIGAQYLLDEGSELVAILATSLNTARRNAKRSGDD